MSSTYSQILLHFVFAVRGRDSMIVDPIRERVHQYIGGVLRKTKSQLIAVGSVEDHIHILVALHPLNSPSEIARIIKSNSSKWINEERLTKRVFAWQEGYGVFSHSFSDKDVVVHYIEHQRDASCAQAVSDRVHADVDAVWRELRRGVPL